MPRNGKIVRDALQRAALELFAEQGFDRTTTGAIAARAGVTERTYFRHFADKREVLFDGEAQLREVLIGGLEQLPDDLEPLAALLSAFHGAVPLLEGNRHVSEPRARVIQVTPALQEREWAKVASLTGMLEERLRMRGVDERSAQLCARIGMDAFAITTQRWMDDPAPGLHAELDAAFGELATLAASLPAGRRPAKAS